MAVVAFSTNVKFAEATTARPTPPKEVSVEDAALAERFAELGRRTLQTRNPSPAMWRQAAALLEAANMLNPSDERYVRLMAEYETQAHETKDAILAYYKLLAPTMNPEHRGARLALIDIYVQTLETADQKLAYLKDMIGPRGKFDEVRSYAATRAAKIYLDKAQNDQAMAMVSQALRLNPLNYEAAAMRGRLLPASATPPERTQALISILRINPGEPDYSLALARQLGALGMMEQSLIWYTTCGNTILKLGQTAPVPMVVEYACELYLSDQIANTKLVTTNLLTADDNSTEAWAMRLLLDKEDKNQDAADQQKASLALINRLQIARKLAGAANATTRPVSTKTPVEIPDLAGDMDAIKATAAKDKAPADKEQELRGSYIAAITDLLWNQAYFLKHQADPKLVSFLRTLVGPQSLALARVEGWDLFNQNKLEEAKVKLSAAADSDPLSKMALILIEAKDPKQLAAAKAEAKKLLNQHPTGIVGAVLYGGLKELGVKVEAAKEAPAVDAELRKLPRDWVFIMDTPQNFYTVRVDPLQISHDFSEPVLAQVTIQNVSDIDLPVGANCVLHPDLVFDVEQPGAQGPVSFPSCAYDRITEQVVLKAKKSMAMRVRIDQGQQLTEYLLLHPWQPVLMRIAVTTNPMSGKDQNGKDMISAGPAGQRVQMPRVVERRATILSNQAGQQKVFNRVAQGSGADKMRAMEVLSVSSMLIVQDKNTTEELKATAQEFEGKVFNFSDPSPSVMAWNSFLKTALGTTQESQDAVRAMANSPAWTMQLLSMVPARAMPPAEERAIVEKLTRSNFPIVAKFAQARLEMINQIAIQQQQQQQQQPTASTQPSAPGGGPTLGPAAPAAGNSEAAPGAASATRPAIAADPTGAGAAQPPQAPTK